MGLQVFYDSQSERQLCVLFVVEKNHGMAKEVGCDNNITTNNEGDRNSIIDQLCLASEHLVMFWNSILPTVNSSEIVVFTNVEKV